MTKENYMTIYNKEGIAVRTCPNEPGQYEVIVGEVSDIFQGFEVMECVEKNTSEKNLMQLRYRHKHLIKALKQKKLTVDGLALALARVKLIEERRKVSDLEMRNLRIAVNAHLPVGVR